MKKSIFIFDYSTFQAVKLSIFVVFVAILSGCAGSIEQGDPLIPVGDETTGPGLFTGESGVFYVVGGDSKQLARTSHTTPKDLSIQTLQGTSEILEQKIQELEQQQKELEELKREVNKKLEAS